MSCSYCPTLPKLCPLKAGEIFVLMTILVMRACAGLALIRTAPVPTSAVADPSMIELKSAVEELRIRNKPLMAHNLPMAALALEQPRLASEVGRSWNGPRLAPKSL